MSTLNADLYDALRAAKVDEALARRGAESVTSQPQRTETLLREMREGFHRLDVKVARLDFHMKILIAGVAALVLRSFFFPV